MGQFLDLKKNVNVSASHYRYTSNEHSTTIQLCFKQIIHIFVFWAPNAQILKFGDRPPNFWNLQKNVKVSESCYQYASNEPPTTIQSCFKLKLCLFLSFGPQMPNYRKSAPDLPIFGIKKNILTFWNRVIDTLPKSLQPPSNRVPNSNYFYFCVLGPKCPNMEIQPRPSNFCNLKKNQRFQAALNHHPIMFQTQIMPILCCFGL